jgi:hypothetical protein
MMTLKDLHVLCAALGFTAVVMQGGKVPKKEGAIRATAFSGLIEEFCRATVPDAFDETTKDGRRASDPAAPQDEAKFAVVQSMATAIVAIMREQGGCVPHDLAAKGFSHEEIDRHWAMAKALAYVELKIMDS